MAARVKHAPTFVDQARVIQLIGKRRPTRGLLDQPYLILREIRDEVAKKFKISGNAELA
jgi:hypothetical protein